MNEFTEQIASALSTNYMLVKFSMSKWEGNKTDKKASRKLTDDAHADKRAARVVKQLMVGANAEHKAVSSAFNAVRQYVYTHTLPWSTNDVKMTGPRLLSTATSMQFMKGHAELVRTANTALQEFLAVYDQRRQEALLSQGTLADASDYPTKEQLETSYSLTVDYEPIPDGASFNNMQVPTQIAEALGSRVAASQVKAIRNAMTALQMRLVDELKRMAEQLGKHGRGEKTKLYNSLITNMSTIVSLLETSNINNKQEIRDLAMDIRSKLCSTSIDALKASPHKAAEVAKSAQSLLGTVDEFEWF